MTDRAFCRRSTLGTALAVLGAALWLAPLVAQTATSAPGNGASGKRTASAPAPDAAVPAGYTIGAEDVLNVVFWREPDMSAEVVVRPDGKISLPLLNDVAALGLTPDQLRGLLTEQARKFIAEPSVSVVIKQIHSRKVFITGNVERPGSYGIGSPMTVLQLIAMAGGLREYADAKHIVIARTENGKSISLPFNYNDISKNKNLQQNVELKPGDTVIVP
uniref:Periplasmic protein involved in polysaccharide export n=1 Tax=uncultured bacterium lac193 TaxID=1447243 RepID=X2LCN5_9BACT|nr:periplasmic protein involved in polysaccharide export [uncultured bacterium lac193]